MHYYFLICFFLKIISYQWYFVSLTLSLHLHMNKLYTVWDFIYYYRISNIFWFFNIININGCCYFTIWDIELRNSFGFFVSYRTHEQKQRCDIEKETLLFMIQIMVFLSFISLHRSHRFSWFVDDLLTQYYVLFSSLSCKNNS